MKSESPSQLSYIRVQEEIRRKILDGVWQPGQKIPTERDLEKDFGLSRMTISKGLGNLVAEGYLVRRQGQGTFVTDSLGRSDTARLIKYISPIGSKGELPFRYGILEAMHEILDDQGYDTGVDFYHTADEQAKYLRRNDETYQAGFLVFYEPGDESSMELERLKSEGFPFVLIDAYPPDMDMDFVVSDNVYGGQLVIDHLVSMGHKRISYITRPIDRTSMSERLSGLLRGLIFHNLPFSEDAIVRLENIGEKAIPEVQAAVESVLNCANPPSAICFSNDDLAIEAVDVLAKRGLRVPEDISIVGYDNIDRAANCQVPLVTVAQDFLGMARQASSVLLEKIEGLLGNRPVQVFIKPQLVTRESVARLD